MEEPITDRNDQSSASEVTRRVTSFASLLAVLTAASYVLGFIIVNTHLAAYGITETALIKPIYVSAGLTYLAVVGTFWYVIIRHLPGVNDWATHKFQYFREHDKDGDRWLGVVLFLVVADLAARIAFALIVCNFLFASESSPWQMVVLAFATLAIIPLMLVEGSPHQDRFIRPVTWVLVGALDVTLAIGAMAFATPFVLYLSILFLSWLFLALILLERMKRIPANFIQLTYTMIFASIAGAFLFSATVYPFVKLALGGGERRPVDIVLAQSHPSGLQTLGITLQDNVIRRAGVLTESSEGLALIIPWDAKPDSGRTVRLERSLVSAIAIAKPK